MLVEWSLITLWFGRVSTARALVSAASGEQLATMLGTSGDAHMRSGVRLLRDADERSGEARNLKLVLALSEFESSYEFYRSGAEGKMRWLWEGWFGGRYARASERAAQVSLIRAGIYKAHGNDPKSVEQCIADTRRMFDLYVDAYIAQHDAPGGGYPAPPTAIEIGRQNIRSTTDEKRDEMEAAIAALKALPPR
jgi:hypothetical protein